MTPTLTYDKFDFTPHLTSQNEIRIRIDFLLSDLLMRWHAYKSEYKDRAFGVYYPAVGLRYLLGKNQYKEIIQNLSSAQVIEKIPMKETKSGFNKDLHVFKPLYNEPSKRNVEIPKYIQRPYNSILAYHRYKEKQLGSIDQQLTSNLKQFTIAKDVDLEIIRELFKENYPSYVDKCILGGHPYIPEEEYIFHADGNYHRYQRFNDASTLELANMVSIDRFGNRFHSPLTSIPKFIFNAGLMKIKDQSVIGIDLSQAQAVLLANYLGGLGGSDFTDAVNQTDDIYSYFQFKLGLASRDIAKTYVLKAINSRIESKEFQFFNKVFPIAGKKLHAIKCENLAENPNPSRYTNVGFLMQQEESRIFRPVWKVLMDKGITIGTKHDCILVPSRKVEKAMRIITSEMDKSIVHCKYEFHQELPIDNLK